MGFSSEPHTLGVVPHTCNPRAREVDAERAQKFKAILNSIMGLFNTGYTKGKCHLHIGDRDVLWFQGSNPSYDHVAPLKKKTSQRPHFEHKQQLRPGENKAEAPSGHNLLIIWRGFSCSISAEQGVRTR